jgi:putative oxidoreductase
MKTLSFIGKLLFALPFAMFGYYQFTTATELSFLIPTYLAMPIVWVYFVGVAEILAAVAIIIGKKAKLATALLGVMLLCFVGMVHLKGFLIQTQPDTAMFLKDLALAGSAFFMSANLKS